MAQELGSVPGEITPADICTACSLCCTGALFLMGNVDDDEVHLFDTIGLKRSPSGQAIGFPCPALVNRCCTVYEQRPRVCSAYRCELLRKFDSGIVSGPQAMEIVVRGADLSAAANDGYAGSIADQRAELIEDPDSWLRGPPETQGQRTRRHLALYVLERYLNTHFRGPEQTGLNNPSARRSDALLSRPSESGRPAASPLG